MESDSLVAIKEILKRNDSFNEWGGILHDILKLSLEFDSCFFNHVNRLTNVLAHNIAKSQCELGEHRIWRNFLHST